MIDYEDLEDLIEDLRMCPKHTFGHDPDHCDGCTHDMNGCWEGLMKDAADAIEELQKQLPKWIPVTERLPVVDEIVLVYVAKPIRNCPILLDRIIVTKANNIRWQWHDNIEAVIAWMPLPEPPKEEI